MTKNQKKKVIIIFFGIFFISLNSLNYNIRFNSKTIGQEVVLINPKLSTKLDWNITWGGSDNDEAYAITIDNSNNIYVTGRAESFADNSLVKFDNSGNELWNLTCGVVNQGRDLITDSSGNIYMTGLKNNNIVLVKYNSSGDRIWYEYWNGVSDQLDIANGIALDSSENIYITGFTQNDVTSGYDLDVVLIKYDKDGNQLWNRIWGGIEDDQAYGVAIDSSNNILLTGETWSYGAGQDDVLLMEYDSSGNLIWNKTWGGPLGDLAADIVIDSSNDIFITGWTNNYKNSLLLVKFDSSGNEEWFRTWHKGDSGNIGRSIALDSSENIYISGYFSYENCDIMLILTDIFTCITQNGVDKYKAHLAQTNKNGDDPLELLKMNKFKKWQDYQNKRNFETPFIFSLVRYKRNQWVFSGIYESNGYYDNNEHFIYDTKLLDIHTDLIGRLIIRYKKDFRNAYPKLSTILKDLKIAAILEDKLQIREFPGYENLNIGYHTLKRIIKTEEKSWKTALSNIKGVYLITDSNNGKFYVGAAYGKEAFWDRWTNYVYTKSGDNVAMEHYLKDKDDEYWSGIRFTILEIHSNLTSNDFIQERENYWKNVLLTRKFGYNKN